MWLLTVEEELLVKLEIVARSVEGIDVIPARQKEVSTLGFIWNSMAMI